MKLKKFILGLALLAFTAVQTVCFAQQVPDAAIKNMVAKYKAHNYLGCLQDSETIISKNPSNIYAYYYQGLAYTQLGKKDEAVAAFEKVQSINTNKTIVNYAQKGVSCLNDPEGCASQSEQSDELEKFIKSNKFYDKSVQTEVNKKKLDRIRENINDELGPRKKSEMPTNDEIADAVKTLAKVGFNPMTGINPASMTNPEMMQMNMLLGNNTNQNSGMNNMLPYMLMGQNQNGMQNMSPEMIQSMMMSQMPMY